MCLGDVLNTRETVSVRAQSAALSLFRSLRRELPGKIPLLMNVASALRCTDSHCTWEPRYEFAS